MLKARIVTAALLLAGLLGALFYLPEMGWVAFCALICAGGAWEWGGLAGWRGKTKVVYALVLGTLSFALASSWPGRQPSMSMVTQIAVALVLLAITFWLLVAPFWLKYKWPLGKWSAAVIGCIVLVPPFVVFIVLRHFGPMSVLMAVAPVWVADIAAYFSGRAFGRKKLAPNISPGKTWAGAFGAVVGVMVYGGVVFTVVKLYGGSHSGLAFFFGELAGFLVLDIVWSIGFTALCIEGDLFESLLKRQANVKDSGNLLPGHGGILDRIDSLTSTLPIWPVMYFLFLLMVSISAGGPSS
jgi:phosphatidate cytidylyltransferase